MASMLGRSAGWDLAHYERAFTTSLIHDLSAEEEAERRRTATLVAREIIPAIEEVDIGERAAVLSTLSKIVTELRPPADDLEAQDLRAAVSSYLTLRILGPSRRTRWWLYGVNMMGFLFLITLLAAMGVPDVLACVLAIPLLFFGWYVLVHRLARHLYDQQIDRAMAVFQNPQPR